MLAGRAFQGAGSGIILSLVEIILADLVSLAERGAYQGAFGAVWALASATGPPIGGALASSNYRWLFYLNLPLTAVIIGVVAAFVNLKTPSGTIRSKLARMDWFVPMRRSRTHAANLRDDRLGNLIFIPSITLLIVGLLKGGQPDPWSSAGVIAPLIIGAVGLIAWYLVERYYVAHPTVPFELLMNRTTAIGYATTWLQGVSAMCLFYFWPVYFQAVKGASPVECVLSPFERTERGLTTFADPQSTSSPSRASSLILPSPSVIDLTVTSQVHRRSLCDGYRRFDRNPPVLPTSERYRLGYVLPSLLLRSTKSLLSVLMTVGPGILSLVSANSPKAAWVPLYAPLLPSSLSLTPSQPDRLLDRNRHALPRDRLPRPRPPPSLPRRPRPLVPRLYAQPR